MQELCSLTDLQSVAMYTSQQFNSCSFRHICSHLDTGIDKGTGLKKQILQRAAK